MPTATIRHTRDIRIAIVQLTVLLGLCLLAYLPELNSIVPLALSDWEAAHLLAAPVLIGSLIYLRRRELAAALTGPSWLGVGLITASLLFCLFATWPFNYGYPRRLLIVLTAGGAIWTVCGWRVLKLSIPMLILLMIAIPTGSRYYAFLIIKPEHYTVQAVTATLDLLPGTHVYHEGADMFFEHSTGSGTIALGEPTRGASLLLSYLLIGAFVTFSRIRPMWKIIVMMLAAGPVVLICNYLRLMAYGLVTIAGGASPLSSAPRSTATAISLVLAYGLAVMVLWMLDKLILDAPTSHDAAPASDAA